MNSVTKRVFKFIFVTLFVDLLAFTLILPLLPKILDYYAKNDESNTYNKFQDNLRVLQQFFGVPESHNHVLLAGLLGSWFSLLQFISSPLMGALSDRYGRKPILLLAMAGSSASYVIWFLAGKSFGLFILSRTVGGLCKANVGLSLAVISDVSDEESRGKGMAVVGSSFSLAFIFGPLLGAYLTTMSRDDMQSESQLIAYPSLIATLLSLTNLALVASFFQETIQALKKFHPSNKNAHDKNFSKAVHYINPKSLFCFKLVPIRSRKEHEILTKTGFIYFYYLLFYSGLEYTLSFLTHLRFGFSPMDQGKLYLFSGSLMALIQGGYIRRMKGRKEASVALIGLILIIPSFAIIGIASEIRHVYFALILYSFSSAIVVPCLTTIVSAQGSSDSKGVLMGTFRSTGALARCLGPFIASIMFWTFGPVVCYIGGAIALILPLYMMSKLRPRLNTSHPELKSSKDKSLLYSGKIAKAS